MPPTIEPTVIHLVAQFHRVLISLERFDNEYVRPRVGTTDDHPPREFAIVTTYLRSLAHVRTLIDLNNGRHFQATSILARALFELAVEIPLIDKVEDGPEKHRIFSDVERLRAARQIVAFHAVGNVQEPLEHLWVHETFIANNADRIEDAARTIWPSNPQPNHWSQMKLPRRVAVLGAPFEEIYNIHYAELSWYTHPGVGVIATFDVNMYPMIVATHTASLFAPTSRH